MWPKDLVITPREWAERFYNVHQYSSQKRGGHFPAWEAPEANALAERGSRFLKTNNI
jgi:microsomal epoxide hydrolase